MLMDLKKKSPKRPIAVISVPHPEMHLMHLARITNAADG